MRLRFTIRDLFWLAIVLAMAVGWWLDHRYLYQRVDSAENALWLSEHTIRPTETIRFATMPDDTTLLAPPPAAK
jgi:hypothetical protein